MKNSCSSQTYLLFVSVTVFGKDRTCCKPPVSNMKYQLLFRFDWLVVAVVMMHEEVNDGHLLLVRQKTEHDERTTRSKIIYRPHK